MVIDYILFFFGIYVLIKSADWIVNGASSLARKLGVPSIIVGLTVVAFGTSLPELVVNIFAALSGNGDVAFGNVVGSNIANVLLVLGIVATIGGVRVQRDTVWKEIPFAMFAAFILFMITGGIVRGKDFLLRSDGFVLLGFFAIFLYYIFQTTKDKGTFDVKEVVDRSEILIWLKLVLGLIGVYFGGEWVVDGAVIMANYFGISDFFISATIIAIGTSLPELVVSVVAVLKKNADLAIGNIIGSNIFNILWVLGIIPLICQIPIPKFIGFDIGIMFLSTVVLFLFMFIGKKHELRRVDGILLLIGYSAYIWFVVARG